MAALVNDMFQLTKLQDTDRLKTSNLRVENRLNISKVWFKGMHRRRDQHPFGCGADSDLTWPINRDLSPVSCSAWSAMPYALP